MVHMTINKKLLFISLAFFLSVTSCKVAEKKNKISENKTVTSQKLALDGIFIDANKEKLLGNYKNAIELYTTVINKDPGYSAAYYEVARIFQSQNRNAEALLYAKKAVDLYPENIWYQILLSDLYKDNQQYKESSIVWKNIVDKNPDNIDYYYDLANAYLYEKNYTEAIKVYDVIEKKSGITESISLQKQKIYLSLNKFDKAVAEVENLTETFPSETKYLAMLAEMYMSKKDFTKAIIYYNKILEKDPKDKFIHISLASYYRESGDKEKSYQELKKGFSNPNLEIDTKIQILLSYYTITEIYNELKSQAFELADILVKTHPNEAKAYSISGDFLYRDKKFSEAREAFRKVNQIDSSKYEIWETILVINSELNDSIAIINEGERAIELFPEQPLLYLFTGTSYFQTNQLQKALQKLETGVKLVVDNEKLLSQFYTYLGDIYYKNKDYDKAFKAFKMNLEIDPENVYVLNNYTYYLSLQNEELDKAEQMGRKLNNLEPNNSSYQDTYAWVFYKLGKYDEAKKWILKSLENGGNENDIILEHAGDIYYKTGDTTKAYEYWLKAKKAGNGSEFLQKKIDEKKLYE